MPDAQENYIQELEREVEEQKAFAEAIREEFSKLNKENPEWSSEDLREKIRNDLIPSAFSQLKILMESAESESVRANLIKYILDSELNKPVKPGDTGDVDESFRKLIEGLAVDKAGQ